MASDITWSELAALAAVGRGATELRMASRVQARLLALGLIHQPGGHFSITEAGRRMLTPHRTNRWL
jgi:predicted transcriptional regulator